MLDQLGVLTKGLVPKASFFFEFEVISYQTVLQLCFAAQTYCIMA